MGKDELYSQTELSANSSLSIIKDTDLDILFHSSRCLLGYLGYEIYNNLLSGMH